MDNRLISKSNQRLTWIRNGIWAIATSLQAASVLQALFLKLGITTERIAIYFSVMQIVSLASTFLTTSLPRYITNTKKGDAIATILTGILFLGNVIVCLFAGIALNIKWIIILVVGCFVNMFLAVRTVFDYKLPCELIIMSDYSFFTAVDGIVQGLCSIPIAFLMPVLYSRFNYEKVTAIAFSVSVILMAITSIITMSFRKLDIAVNEKPVDEKASILPLNDIKNLLHNKEFMFLAIPNIIRGFGAGIYTLIPTLAISSGCFTEINVMLITGTGQAAVFVSCVLCLDRQKVRDTKHDSTAARSFCRYTGSGIDSRNEALRYPLPVLLFRRLRRLQHHVLCSTRYGLQKCGRRYNQSFPYMAHGVNNSRKRDSDLCRRCVFGKHQCYCLHDYRCNLYVGLLYRVLSLVQEKSHCPLIENTASCIGDVVFLFSSFKDMKKYRKKLLLSAHD